MFPDVDERDLLVWLVTKVRAEVDGPQWDRPGVLKYVGQVAALQRPFRWKALACLRYAADARNITPRNLADVLGPHWTQPLPGGAALPPGSQAPRCPKHEGEELGKCRWCAADYKVRDSTDVGPKGDYEAGAARVREALSKPRGETK